MSSGSDHDSGEMPEEVVEFLVESNENLDRLDQDLMALESNPHDKERLSSIFRTIHTIKGTCGFLGYSKLESVTHVGENLLSKLRDGTFVLNATLTDALLAMVDATRAMLHSIESTQSDGDGDYTALVSLLSELTVNGGEGSAAEADGAASIDGESEPTSVLSQNRDEPTVSSNALVFSTKKPDAPPVSTIGSAELAADVAPVMESSENVEVAEPASVTMVTSARQESSSSGSSRATSAESHEGAPVPADVRSVVSDSSIRVDVALLDRLMDLVGELVLARNQILQFTAAESSSALISTTQRLNLITSELQESVMKTRMQPIGNVLTKLPRVVRDLARSCSKLVRLDLEGKETELDRTIIESIKDPLTHLIRNGVDHAIETPELRKAAGKPLEGVIAISAYHEGGYVNIEIRDDGAGIDPEKIRAKAVEKGIHTPETAQKLSDRDVINLIFSAGFSTAEKITNVSGRGVGMDVVKTNIERIGGTIEVSSQVGIGTVFRIRIPLTLAIVPALVVTCVDQRYAIPQASLLELLRLEREQIDADVSVLDGAPVYRLRGHLLPLVDLAEVLGISDGEHPWTKESLNIVVLQAEETQFGLVVDGVVDTQEIVVKPLGRQVKAVTTFSGATIMGDGRVALIVDVAGVAHLGRVLRSARDTESKTTVTRQVEDLGEKQTLLLVQVGDSGRVAVPLQSIDRLEEFRADAVEWAGGQPVVQYRNTIMPLLWLSTAVGLTSASDPGETYQVVVHSANSRSVGVVVDAILDITEQRVTLDHYAARLGVLGSAVISDRVTEVVDLSVIIGDFLSDLVGIGV
ncbi:MAG: chemotaxis protein CheA [Acidimicrobiales bacterium]